VLFSTIEAALSLANLGTRTHASLSDSPVSAHHVKYVLTDDLTSGEISQLQNINTNLISDAEWAIVAGLVALGSGTIISTAERNALHAAFTAPDAVDAIEGVGAGSVVAGDSIVFIDLDDGILKKDLVSNLPGGGYSDPDAVDALEAVANAPVATGDSVLFVDVTDGVMKQDLVSDLLALGGGGPDPDAIHDNVADEIHLITAKAVPVGADVLLIEDSAGATWDKKASTIAQIEAILSLANLATRTHASLSDSPPGAHHVKYALLDDLIANEITAIQNINANSITSAIWAIIAGLTSIGSGDIITSGERTALHTQTPAEVHTSMAQDTSPQLGGDLDLNNNALTEEFIADENLANGDLCYMNTGGSMAKADASAEATCDTLLAMCTESITALSTGTFVLFGRYTTSGLTAGAEYFVSETTAAITLTRPTTSAAIVRHVCSAVSTTVLFFNPSGTYVEVA